MKRNTIKKMILGLIVVSTLLQADRYLLIMSKDDKVCHRVSKILNDDLKEYKELKLQTHKEFNVIKWDKEFIFYLTGTGKNKPYKDYCSRSTGCKNAIFDINNDGKDELVAFREELLKSTRSGDAGYNEILYLPKETNEFFKFDISKGTVDIGSEHYYKELPKQVSSLFGSKHTDTVYMSTGNTTTLRPFKIDNTYYISTFFSTFGQKDYDESSKRGQKVSSIGISGAYDYYRILWSDINYQNFVSISKYDATNKPTDTCYLIKIFTNKKHSTKDN
ncbi:hypothetical protein [Sulfurimonas sp.]|uniref:hypothetical protein n=1 Tax=Sulfurimonas sp. TaxID=2022749 RepID=UPI002B46B32F|nr:hypothetical protein [Sulfurimonas sp.]